MASSTCLNILEDNADITGIGVRVSFYIQASLTIFISYLPGANVDSSYWSMAITALALFVSALSLHSQGRLSLCLTMSVSILLYLHAFAAWFSLLGGVVTRRQSINTTTALETHELHHSMRKLRLWSIPVISIAVSFSLYVWHRPSSFGPHAADCNTHTVLVILGSHLLATETGQIASLTISYIVLLYLVIYAFWDFHALLLSMTRPDYVDHGTVEAGAYATVFRELPQSELGHKLGLDDNSMAGCSISEILTTFFKSLSLYYSVLVTVGLIVSNELTLRANGPLMSASSDAGSIWTLGQIFPLVMLLVPAFIILEYFLSPVMILVRTFIQEIVLL